MPAYKLTYFNSRGFAELSRLIFAQADVEYEDHRIQRESWPGLKPTTPFGQLPVLEVDGQTIAQSVSIARFLAHEFNLAGETPMEVALADAVVGAFGDLLTALVGVYFYKNEDDKNESMGKLPGLLTSLEGYLCKQNGGDGFFVGKKLTWADLRAYDLISRMKGQLASTLDPFPKLSAHCDRIGALPNIKAWVDKRPETEF